MKDLINRLRQPSDFYFTDQMTAKKANALYTSLLQDGADAIEKLEAENAQLKAELAAMREQKPVAYWNPQERNRFYWATHTLVNAPITVSVQPMALYAAPGAQP